MHPCRQLRHHTYVKNTFIDFKVDLADESKEKRRPSSLPPAVRLCSSADVAQVKATDASRETSDGKIPVRQDLGHAGKWITVGTKRIFVPPTPTDAPPTIPDGDRVDNSWQALGQSIPSFSQDVSTEASEEDMTSEGGDSSTVGNTSVDIETPTRDTTSSSPQSNRQRNSKSQNTRGIQASFGYEIAEVLLMVKSMLVPYFPTSMEFCQNTSCWLFNVQIPSKHMSWEMAVDLAKDALIQACAETHDVELLASRTEPFLAMPNGFVATLALVSDSHQVCWEMLQTGFCRFGNYCHWQHPVRQRQVFVNLSLPNH